MLNREMASHRSRQTDNGSTRHYWDYLGKTSGRGGGPEAFVVRVEAGDEIGAHFHSVNQFQVFAAGDGAMFQRKPIPQRMLHYTDAHTAYGPFGPGPKSFFEFFTLRPEPSSITGFMPESRHRRHREGPHRSREVDVSRAMPEKRRTASDGVLQELIPPESGGLAACLLSVGPGLELAEPDLPPGGGQYHLVIDGTLGLGDQHHGKDALAWRPAGAPWPAYVGSGEGLSHLLVVQFPSDH